MLEFKDSAAPCWIAMVFQGKEVHACQVALSAEEAAGGALLKMRELLGDKFKVDIRNNADGKFVILGASTANGYPVPEETEAFILPSQYTD